MSYDMVFTGVEVLENEKKPLPGMTTSWTISLCILAQGELVADANLTKANVIPIGGFFDPLKEYSARSCFFNIMGIQKPCMISIPCLLYTWNGKTVILNGLEIYPIHGMLVKADDAKAIKYALESKRAYKG